MIRTFCFLSLLIVLGLAAATACAQVQTGTPPFGSFGGGPDVVNLGNLNDHITIPVRHKAGRGTNFDYVLAYDSSVWQVISSTWQPTSTTTVPGWQGLLPAGQSYIGYSMTYSSSNCGYMGQSSYQSWSYSNFYYYDQFGVSHPMGVNGGTYFNSPGPPYCPPNGPQPTTTPWSGTANDGSGYTLYVNPNQGYVYANLVDKNGTTINAPIVANPPSYWGSSSTTDRNGNQITSSNGTYTDTLGTQALSVIGAAPSNTNISYTAPSGATATYVVSYRTYTVRTNFGCSGITEYNALGTTQTSLVDKVTLPDGSSYQFGYEITYQDTHSPHHVTGRIASVTLPTGGTISYQYSSGGTGVNEISCADGSATTLIRTTPDTGTNSWTYVRTQVSGTHWQTLISDPTTPTSNQTLIDFQKDSGSTTNFYETERRIYQGLTSGTLVLTTNTCYNGAALPCIATAVTSPINSVTRVSILPGTNNLQSKQVSFHNTYGLVTEVDAYDYASGAPPSTPIRKTLTAYASLGNIFNLPASVTVQDGSGATKAQTTYTYDQGAPTATSGTPQHAAVSGSRGNATTITQLVQGSTTLSKAFTYYDTGTIQTATDVNGAGTTFNYADATSTCGNAFPTSVTEPLGLSRSMTWNCTGGVNLTFVDENNRTTTISYNDPYFWRTNAVADQLGNQTAFYYQPNPTYCCPTAMASSLTFNNGNSLVEDLQYKDGLGRTYVDQRPQGPGSSTLDSVSYAYDANGRLYSISIPCSIGYAATCSTPKTTTTYDPLNRPLQTTDGGGGYVSYLYLQNDVLVTGGPAPSGENTKRRQLEYNALGQLTSVCEITAASPSGNCGQQTSAAGYLTKYTYDALGNLTGVTQNAQPGGTAQARSYAYDALSRLTSETNPESGTTTYAYDTDSSCGSSSGDLVKLINAAGNMICFYRDTLHRVTSEIIYYSPNQQGNRYFVYDTATVNGQAMQNGKTRLVEAFTAGCPTCSKITDAGFSYSARGEVTDAYQSTPNSGGYYHVSQTYWPHGAASQLSSNIAGLPTISYGGTIGSTVGLDGEGRITQVTAASGQNPVTGVTYNNSSLPSQVTFGSADTDIFAYDSNTMRMTQYQFNVNGQSDTGALTWNPNSTLQKLVVTDAFNSADNQTCNYGYDDIVRLVSANCGAAAAQTFTYDPFGNINKSGSPYSFQPTYSSATNRMTWLPGNFTPTYDANGNVTNDSNHTYAWDANGNSITIDGLGLTFDALDRAVEKNVSGSYTQIVYAPTGDKLALMNGQTLQKAFVPLPGQATAVYTGGGLDHYRHSDWLGSSRLSSSPTRTVVSTAAYAPFGESYAQSGTADLSFTGQNQDTVSGDYDFLFREYSTEGRWPSPDPAGLGAVNPLNPQSWNRYAYVLNNPLGLIDPLGLYCQWDDGTSDDTVSNGGANPSECAAQGGVWIPDSESNFMNGDPNGVQTCVSIGGVSQGCGSTAFGPQPQTDPTFDASNPGIDWAWWGTFTMSFFTFSGGPGNKPTCAGEALRQITDGLVGGVVNHPALEASAKSASQIQELRALKYAANQVNTHGGTGLLCNGCSSTFRRMMGKAKFLGEVADAALLVEVSVEAGKATADVSGQARNGECAAALPIF